MTERKTELVIYAALFVALTAICSWISIPLPFTAVPLNLATFAVILSGAVLGKKYGPFAMTVFLLLGAIGIPVFHSFTGGLGIIVGPTGGFLIGYIALAFFAGISRDGKFGLVKMAIIGEAVLYLLGCIWFICVTKSTVQAAFLACVLPFLPGDAIKIVLAKLVNVRLEKAGLIDSSSK